MRSWNSEESAIRIRADCKCGRADARWRTLPYLGQVLPGRHLLRADFRCSRGKETDKGCCPGSTGEQNMADSFCQEGIYPEQTPAVAEGMKQRLLSWTNIGTEHCRQVLPGRRLLTAESSFGRVNQTQKKLSGTNTGTKHVKHWNRLCKVC